MKYSKFAVARHRAAFLLASTSFLLLYQSAKSGDDYLVVSFVEESDPYYEAAKVLESRHDSRTVRSAPDALDDLLAELRESSRDFLAVVIRPEDLDVNLVGKFFKLSTEVDDDPFVDFSHGFITGRNADAALRLVEASDPGKRRRTPKIAQFGVAGGAIPESLRQESGMPLGSGMVPMTVFMSKGDSDETADSEFIEEALPSLEESSILLLASHGYPDGLVGGPKARDVTGLDLDGAVALNIACYTGVTHKWFEDDWSTMKVREHTVAPDDSFALAMLDTGVAGYVAYSCPRPAGPTMIGDAAIIATAGLSLGEQRRRDYNSTVLAHLLRGDDHLKFEPRTDGNAIKPNRTAADSVAKMSTGGLLFGDPAFVPFDEQDGMDVRVQTVEDSGDKMVVNVRINSAAFHLFAGEQINYWEDAKPALRLETTVDIGHRNVSDVALIESPIPNAEYRLVAAVEDVGEKRILHMKAVFAQPEIAVLQQLAMGGFGGSFEIEFSGNEATDSVIRKKSESEDE